MTSSCAAPYKGEINKIIEVLDKAIGTLDRASSDWQKVLEETRDEIISETQSTIKNEINGIIQEGIASAGAEFRCNFDFARVRARYELIDLRNSLASQVGIQLIPSSREPELCQVNPSSINLSLPPQRRSELKIAGYDFDQGGLQLVLRSGSQEEDVSAYLAKPTHYLLTVNLGSNGIGQKISPVSDKLILRADGKEISSINIIQPTKQPPKPDNSAFITDLYVSSERSSGNRCPSGMTWISQDLNQGSGGNYIYLCYDRGGTTPITDLRVTSSGSAGNICGSGWKWINKDLNKGAKGDYIYFCYRTDGNSPIKEIKFTSRSSAGNVCGSGWEWINKDLNKGAGGKYIYTCYQK
ncbi:MULTISPECIES: hypothetical protein [Moorena]|uniref:hypothetical protein n=1 Tax=Moorena TaxID=1155738 RepID=UPI0013142DB2|nr:MULTISPECIES: hypothetical protein [Moorena]NEP23726.1 hypothetical protein [Moorena sp. SIO3I6]